MGYQHWRLGKGDAYQLGVARMRVAEMLHAHAKGIEGPLALACEAPIDGWDDIVEYGARQGCLTVTHHQVKRQNTNFAASEKTETFGDLFERATKLLADADPYNGLPVPPEHRYFRFVLPTDTIAVGAKLGIAALRTLLEECVGNEADTIVANKGKNRGDQEREWLKLIGTAAGTDDACARLLRQMRVELRPVASVEGNGALAALFENAALARDLVDKAIRDTAPEGWLDAEELLPKLSDAKPNPAMRQVRLAQHEGRFYAQPHARLQDVRAVAEAIVAKVWAAHAAADLHVSFPLPDGTSSDGAKALRLACIRLLLHAPRSPAYVSGDKGWYERSRLEVKRTLGLVGASSSLEAAHFVERAAPRSLPPKASWTPEELAAALHDAMDARVWDAVRQEGAKALVGAKEIPFDELAAFLTNSVGVLERVLHGWWGLERAASGVARAGPAIAPNVARIVAGLAVLQLSEHGMSSVNDQTDIAKVGELPLRALGIDEAPVTYDGEPHPVGLSEHAREILVHAGVVLIVRGDVSDFYTFATMRPMDELADGASMRDSTPSAFLMSSESLITAARKGANVASNLIQQWCNDRARHHRAALDAAVQQWKESRAA